MLYLGSVWDARLHRFDPARLELGVVDLGSRGEGSTFPTGNAEDPDGTLWIGTAPESRLIKYESETGEFTQIGRMHEEENYLYPLAGDDGTIAALVWVVRPHIVMVDPADGRTSESRASDHGCYGQVAVSTVI